MLQRFVDAAAKVLDGRRAVVPAMAVPGSGLVKAQAEAEGLDAIFKRAGFEWREAGCSMCVGMNGDLVALKSTPLRCPDKAGHGCFQGKLTQTRHPTDALGLQSRRAEAGAVQVATGTASTVFLGSDGAGGNAC